MRKILFLPLAAVLALMLSIHANAGGSSQSAPIYFDSVLSNIVVGAGTLQAVTSGNFNECVGFNSCSALTSGTNNTVVTNGEGVITTGNFNLVVGYPSRVVSGSTQSAISLGGGSAGSFDIAIGTGALQTTSTDGNGNTAIGYGALNNLTTGVNNVAVGYVAGGKQAGGVSNNTIVGNSAGFGAGPASSYSNSTIIGYNVGSSAKSGSYNLALGVSTSCDVSGNSASNEIHICGKAGDWAKVTGTDTQATQVTLFYGSGIGMGAATTPANNATCTAGTFWWDTGFIYVCTASGTVKRAALSTF